MCVCVCVCYMFVKILDESSRLEIMVQLLDYNFLFSGIFITPEVF